MFEPTKSTTNKEDSEKVIDLSFKSLTTFPKCSSNLVLLYLGNNNIKEIPEKFFETVPTLKWFDVRNNLIEKIPGSIKNHMNIETMLFQNNRISYLPCELSTTKKLKYIQLSGNPIIYPNKSIIKLGTRALIKYLHLQCEQIDISKTILNEDQFIDVSLKQFENETELDEKEANDIRKHQESSNENFKSKKVRNSFLQQNYSISLPIMNSLNLSVKKEKHINKNKYLKNKSIENEEYCKIIEERFMKDIWLEKKKEILSQREKVIQDKKSLAALKNWRTNYKNDQVMHPNTYYALNLTNIPYDIDLNYIKILTRADIESDLPDKYKKNLSKKNSVSDTKMRKQYFQNKLKEMTEDVQTIKCENYDFTPRTERKVIGCRIRKLTNMKNKLVKLKTENDQII